MAEKSGHSHNKPLARESSGEQTENHVAIKNPFRAIAAKMLLKFGRS
jgi:hypothetical protein